MASSPPNNDPVRAAAPDRIRARTPWLPVLSGALVIGVVAWCIHLSISVNTLCTRVQDHVHVVSGLTTLELALDGLLEGLDPPDASPPDRTSVVPLAARFITSMQEADFPQGPPPAELLAALSLAQSLAGPQASPSVTFDAARDARHTLHAADRRLHGLITDQRDEQAAISSALDSRWRQITVLAVVASLFAAATAWLLRLAKNESARCRAAESLVRESKERLEARVVERTRELSDAKERVSLLMRELDHRVRNNFIAIGMLLEHSARNAASVPALVESFKLRIEAVARAHDVIARSAAGEVDLLAVISKCLALYDPSNDGRVLLEGDPQRIPSRAALPLCMALQELGNNASKYGALSQPGGRVRVAWRFEKTSNLLRINWAEQGGPPVQPPTHRGFGSDLIQNTVAHDLGGDVSLSFPATGARCEICFPIGRLTPPPL